MTKMVLPNGSLELSASPTTAKCWSKTMSMSSWLVLILASGMEMMDRSVYCARAWCSSTHGSLLKLQPA